MAAFYTIQGRDVNKPVITAFGQKWLVQNFMGQILPADVGKRVFKAGDILQVENDEQRDRRDAYSDATS